MATYLQVDQTPVAVDDNGNPIEYKNNLLGQVESLADFIYEGAGDLTINGSGKNALMRCNLANLQLALTGENTKAWHNNLVSARVYCNLENADLRDNLLSDCVVKGHWDTVTATDETYRHCTFTGVTFTGCDLTGATFDECRFTYAEADKATTWPAGFDPADHGITIS